MKVIDLYVMVSKGEQPKKFKYRDEWWVYSVDDYDFRTLKQEYGDYEYLMSIIDTSNLNDEIEIIIEEKEIEKLPLLANTKVRCEDDFLSRVLTNNNKEHNELINKINELVREVNKIKKEGK